MSNCCPVLGSILLIGIPICGGGGPGGGPPSGGGGPGAMPPSVQPGGAPGPGGYKKLVKNRQKLIL